MKKILFILILLLVAFSISAKGGEEDATTDSAVVEAGPYTDGLYIASEDAFSNSGWKYIATLEIENGYIVTADWNGVYINAGYDKKTVSENGNYKMVQFGGAQSDWHVQAEAAEAYLLETQDPSAIAYKDDKGHTDDIAGVSIHVVEFFSLAEKALANGPVERGPYTDGYYFAEEAGFAGNGWKYFVDITVLNGNIASASWNGVNVIAGDNKKTVSKAGNYKMVQFGGAQSDWHVQAEAAEALLLETQDPTAITYKDDAGHTDDIAGVSIHVIEFFSLAEEALAAGPKSIGPYADGTYHAEEAEFAGNGWKYFADLTVYNGRIVAANWNGVHTSAEYDKKTVSKAGNYNMVQFGGAQSEWDVQAAAAEALLLETQDPTAITYKDDAGHTDDIAGVSIHVIEFFSLAEEALAAGPIPTGAFADGHYHAVEAEFAGNGWKYMVDLTVVNGRIVAANWNGANISSGTDKKTRSKDGEYNMVQFGGAQSEWDVQAAAAEALLLETQDPTAITYKDDAGHTDDIAGVSIHVVEFFSLAEEALAAGTVEVGPYKNGTYHAEAPEFDKNGWKSVVDITVISGNIVAVNFDSVNAEGENKVKLAAEGEYGMVANGGAQASWDVQARTAADYVLAMQTPSVAVDDIAGVSIYVSDLFALAMEAMGL
jgi:major membrane immunogen (membrane-anchored lipoprotein)